MLTIDFQFDSKALYAIIESLQELPSRRAAALQRIIRDGVIHNYDTLSMGGAVIAANGSNIQWSRARNRMTIAIRQRRGLGALFPILTLTGKLRRGLERGSTSTFGDTLYYSVASDVKALVRVHQLGLAPLPSLSSNRIQRSGSRIVSMPPRQMLFWSKSMAEQVRTLASSTVKGGSKP